MWKKCFAFTDARMPQIWTRSRCRRLAGEALLLAAFVITSSWLIQR